MKHTKKLNWSWVFSFKQVQFLLCLSTGDLICLFFCVNDVSSELEIYVFVYFYFIVACWRSDQGDIYFRDGSCQYGEVSSFTVSEDIRGKSSIFIRTWRKIKTNFSHTQEDVFRRFWTRWHTKIWELSDELQLF